MLSNVIALCILFTLFIECSSFSCLYKSCFLKHPTIKFNSITNKMVCDRKNTGNNLCTLFNSKDPSSYEMKDITKDTNIDTDSLSTASTEISTDTDTIFGAEFKLDTTRAETYWKGNKQYTRISPLKRKKVMTGYDNLRVTFLLDNLFISVLGLCLLWSFGTYKDAFSYATGSLCGLGYATLLGRYVESIGGGEGGGGGGAARFAPVLLLILLYSKNKEYISIIPEILGFFTFQLASLLQIFNESAYDDSNKNENNNNDNNNNSLSNNSKIG